MDNAHLTRLVNRKSQPAHFLLSLSFICALNSSERPQWLRVTTLRDRSAMQLAVNEDALASHSCLPVYKKQWFLPHRPSLVLHVPCQRGAAGKKKIQMLWPFCEEYGLVCAEVHFCQDALGFHGAPNERDHTELSAEWQAVQEKAAGNEHDMMDL